ncbi:hypothetical protein GCM10011492_04200 [Flexivirga endophytica]|uniref:Uncharacterized protein n=1 Tax=Flexivirga endophytica TaxID=1849103 RepID=A0A916WPI8_9MICO|nr:hypothetical protein GCM10011492_04200 [Flexivirga endophytica]GHB38109.1 hypothetical protein GCM10008112_03410 [Flexivirga endophytica]
MTFNQVEGPRSSYDETSGPLGGGRMSVLVHLCRSCGHQQTWHSGGNGGYTSCRCCRADECDPAPEPGLLQTLSFPGWQLEPLLAPGTVRNSGSMHATECCVCAACVVAYERLVKTAQSA